MTLAERPHSREIEQVVFLSRRDRMFYQHRTIEARRVPGAKGIAEAGLQLRQRVCHRIGSQRTIDDAIQDANVVEPGDMVGMRMRIEDSVDTGDPAGQQLSSQIRRGIDQKSLFFFAFDDDRGTRTAIAMLPRIAGTPVACPIRSADQWNAGRSARAQECDPHAALRNKRRKFAVVRSASASGAMPLTSASTRAVWAT